MGSRDLIASVEAEFNRFKAAGEAAMAQLGEEQLSAAPAAGNSTAVLVRHIAGNFTSRFTDFLKTDGEKPWRDRDREFDDPALGRAELIAVWNRGWDVVLTTLGTLEDRDLTRTITIRGVNFTVQEALHRALGHAAYHVGQMVFLAKAIRGDAWECLTIPRGASAAYNQNPAFDRPASHSAALNAKTTTSS